MKLTSIFLYILSLRIIRIISQDDENLCPPKQTGESCEDLCKEECHQCYKNGSCYSCEPLFYDEDCNKTCSNCTDEGCSDDGKCTNTEYCRDHQYFGEYCQHECKEINESCLNCNMDGTCNECSEFHYGGRCNNTCFNCIGGCLDDGTCKTEGHCKDDKYYGVKCDKECKELNESCSECIMEGICSKCEENHYGDLCNKICSNCIEGCTKEGKCNNKEYCKDHQYYGDECIKECKEINESCLNCNMDGTCNECSDYHYGDYCNQTCLNCIDGCLEDGTCKTEGHCKDDKYYGVKCDKECKEINESCTTCNMDGICNECSEYHYGDHCNNTCFNCIGGCTKDGKCIGKEYCKDHEYYGEYMNVQNIIMVINAIIHVLIVLMVVQKMENVIIQNIVRIMNIMENIVYKNVKK